MMLESGLLDAVLPHITVDFAAVQFKLLGTLRMVLAKQGKYKEGSGSVPSFMPHPVLFFFNEICLN